MPSDGAPTLSSPQVVTRPPPHEAVQSPFQATSPRPDSHAIWCSPTHASATSRPRSERTRMFRPVQRDAAQARVVDHREVPAAEVRDHDPVELRPGEADVRRRGEQRALRILGQDRQLARGAQVVDAVGPVAGDDHAARVVEGKPVRHRAFDPHDLLVPPARQVDAPDARLERLDDPQPRAVGRHGEAVREMRRGAREHLVAHADAAVVRAPAAAGVGDVERPVGAERRVVREAEAVEHAGSRRAVPAPDARVLAAGDHGAGRVECEAEHEVREPRDLLNAPSSDTL